MDKMNLIGIISLITRIIENNQESLKYFIKSGGILF